MYAGLADIARAGACRSGAALPRRSPCSSTRPSARTRPTAHQHRRRLAHARRLARGAAAGRGRPLEEASRRAARIAWKTGTSWGLRDGWAVGNTRRYTVGVWVGNASGEGRPGLTGSTMAAPLMFALFNALPPSALVRHAHATRCAASTPARTTAILADRRLRGRTHLGAARQPLRCARALTTCASTSTPRGDRRVDGDCESPRAMTHANWFVLPPAEEFYYRASHAEYRPLPAWRADCAGRGRRARLAGAAVSRYRMRGC